jgi:hypothetical protein
MEGRKEIKADSRGKTNKRKEGRKRDKKWRENLHKTNKRRRNSE